ncbi:uncharacterized protein BDR25DRAFT_348795 [Lindgomyces ingoldianus]|uniref:Uncharacterized protein n=1 Tax=Lindgomyces ingoldianus TaxID=673940 RepID=A0ACB6RC43_9PLEO|nr:uncharacterized protein BDR25DRAFT_348795 [Lindgomyces ingoldianus]KAF2476863.1 hypothetical protein BDR25DRAFT_348795 [Lindgomyces ingoldianus]
MSLEIGITWNPARITMVYIEYHGIRDGRSGASNPSPQIFADLQQKWFKELYRESVANMQLAIHEAGLNRWAGVEVYASRRRATNEEPSIRYNDAIGVELEDRSEYLPTHDEKIPEQPKLLDNRLIVASHMSNLNNTAEELKKFEDGTEDSRTMPKATKRDSTSMKAVATLAMVFLLALYISVSFQLMLRTLCHNSSVGLSWQYRCFKWQYILMKVLAFHNFRMYLAIAIPLTGIITNERKGIGIGRLTTRAKWYRNVVFEASTLALSMEKNVPNSWEFTYIKYFDIGKITVKSSSRIVFQLLNFSILRLTDAHIGRREVN